MMTGRNEEWLKALAKHLADCLYAAGEFVERRAVE